MERRLMLNIGRKSFDKVRNRIKLVCDAKSKVRIRSNCEHEEVNNKDIKAGVKKTSPEVREKRAKYFDIQTNENDQMFKN